MIRSRNSIHDSAEAPPQALWRHIFGERNGLLEVFTGIRPEEGKLQQIKENVFNYPHAVDSAAEWAIEKTEEGREVYFCAHLLKEPCRKKENAAKILALYAEKDSGDIPNGHLCPTAVVESSPGRYHLYWRLEEPISPERAERLNKCLTSLIGADPSGWDLTQVLRVPGTVNYKYEDKPLVRLNKIDHDRAYKVEDLERLFPELEDYTEESAPVEQPVSQETPSGETEPPVELGAAALKVYRGEDPKYKEDGKVDTSATLLKIGRVLYDAGANRSAIVPALRERDLALYRKYTDRRDAEKQYAAIFHKLEQEGRGRVKPLFLAKPKLIEQESAQHWPEMGDAAYRGLFGEAVELIAPHTEGDRVAVLINMLTAVGSAIGRGPYFQIGATRHHTNLYAGIVGATSKGRKGSSWDPPLDIMRNTDPRWAEDRIASGLSSGEGLINEVRDRVVGGDPESGIKVLDAGVSDKRLLVVESEFSQPLKVMKREGNTLSPVLRNGWDGTTLRTLVKQSPQRATNPHVSILGHITIDELVRHLTETELANGLANRFIWVLARRSKSLPFGGEWHEVNLDPITTKLAGALEYGTCEMRMTWSQAARPKWEEAYEELSAERGGIVGAVTARGEAQTLRLAMIYALAELSEEIKPSHIESALAVWRYAEASARYIFGEIIGDPDADKVLAELKHAENGMTRTDVRDLFGRNKSAQELNRIREVLVKAGRVRVSSATEGGSKKPVERWTAS